MDEQVLSMLKNVLGTRRAGRLKKLKSRSKNINVASKSSWVERVSWTPLTEDIGLIGFKPKDGHWYTVPNQTYDTFLQLTKEGLVPEAGTGSQMWRFGFLAGKGFVRQRSGELGRVTLGFEQKLAAKKLADQFRISQAAGEAELKRLVAKKLFPGLSLSKRVGNALEMAFFLLKILS